MTLLIYRYVDLNFAVGGATQHDVSKIETNKASVFYFSVPFTAVTTVVWTKTRFVLYVMPVYDMLLGEDVKINKPKMLFIFNLMKRLTIISKAIMYCFCNNNNSATTLPHKTSNTTSEM